MNKQYDNTNRFTLGINKYPKDERSATHAGKINIDGVEYYLNGWEKENRSTGEKFFSGTVKPVAEVAKKGIKEARQAIDNFDDDLDSIPF